MDALEAIRLRRSVRRYTDRPVADEEVDRLLRLALLAPTGHNAQAWSLVVVRDPDRRARLADLVLRGAAAYFAVNRPRATAAPRSTRAWAAEYAETALGSYREVPVWIGAFVVPRFHPEEPLASASSASPRTPRWRSRSRTSSWPRGPAASGPPRRSSTGSSRTSTANCSASRWSRAHYLTPVGHPVEFPVGLRPEAAKARRPWRTLVHDEGWGNPRVA